ncbi:hypothetical protein BDW67DRAFT_150138 [Aspergillus spinulosporus]
MIICRPDRHPEEAGISPTIFMQPHSGATSCDPIIGPRSQKVGCQRKLTDNLGVWDLNALDKLRIDQGFPHHICTRSDLIQSGFLYFPMLSSNQGLVDTLISSIQPHAIGFAYALHAAKKLRGYEHEGQTCIQESFIPAPYLLDTYSVQVSVDCRTMLTFHSLRHSPQSRQLAPLTRDSKSHSTTSLLCMRTRTC